MQALAERVAASGRSAMDAAAASAESATSALAGAARAAGASPARSAAASAPAGTQGAEANGAGLRQRRPGAEGVEMTSSGAGAQQAPVLAHVDGVATHAGERQKEL